MENLNQYKEKMSVSIQELKTQLEEISVDNSDEDDSSVDESELNDDFDTDVKRARDSSESNPSGKVLKKGDKKSEIKIQ
jgi:hypothetical protein